MLIFLVSIKFAVVRGQTRIEGLRPRSLYGEALSAPFRGTRWNEQRNPTPGYISYQNFPYETICPSLVSKEPMFCNGAQDCGSGEICAPGYGGSGKSTCLCFINNDCYKDGVC